MREKPSYEVLEQRVRDLEKAESVHKKVEEALRESESKYRILVENIPRKVFYKNSELAYVSVNDEFARHFGIKQQDFVGKTDYELLPKELAEKYRAEDRRIMAEGRTEEIEESFIQDGREVWVQTIKTPVRDAGNKIIGVLGVAWDISARKQAEAALHESEQKFRALADSTPTAVMLFQNDRYIYVNRAAEGISGYSSEELLGMNVWDLVHPDYKAFIRERVRKRQLGEKATNHYELKILTKDGIEKWIELSGSGTVVDGKHAGIVSVVDITERKHSEIERLKLQSQLIKTQKREAIGVLAGGIAHDFNNILAGIIGYVEIARAGLRNESRDTDYLDRALKACDRAKSLVRQIMALGREAERETMPLQLEPILKEVLSMLRSILPASIEIRQSVVPGIPVVTADPTQFQQVVMNLCMNAAHAIDDEQGVIEVGLDEIRLDDEGVGLWGGLSPGDYVRLRVSDTGVGMPSEVLNKIFDPYFTTRKVGEGAGLGLAVVYGIVKEYGGDISVESEEGGGSTFTVLFPAEERSEGRDPEVIEPGSLLPLGREHILFVDDESAIIDIGREQLQALGYEVTTRSSPLEALELFRADPFRFDLVITDTAMPQMTGDRLALELLSISPDIRIVLCTGFSRRISERRAKEIGIRAFLMKPFSQHEMANTVRMVLDDDR